MPPLSHLTPCTPTTFNLYLAKSLAAALREPALFRLLTFQVPNFISLCILRDASPRNNTPPGDPKGGCSLPPDCFVSRGSTLCVSVS